jgi:hypothetical protein
VTLAFDKGHARFALVKVTGHVYGKHAIQHREFVMTAGEMDARAFTELLTRVSQLLVWCHKSPAYGDLP